MRGRRRCGLVALLLVAGVLALVRDVEDAEVGVGALHLLCRLAPLRRAVRAPVVTPANEGHRQRETLQIQNFLQRSFCTNLLMFLHMYEIYEDFRISMLMFDGCLPGKLGAEDVFLAVLPPAEAVVRCGIQVCVWHSEFRGPSRQTFPVLFMTKKMRGQSQMFRIVFCVDLQVPMFD